MANQLPLLPERTLRHAEIGDIIQVLEHQHRQRIDFTMPARNLRLAEGHLSIAALDDVHVEAREPQITDNGVTPGSPAMSLDVNGFYLPTSVADGQLAGLFGIPVQYLRRLRNEHIPLLDENINQWAKVHSPDKRVLVRLLWGATEGQSHVGVARAILSDRYGARDNLDAVIAMIEGMEAAGLNVSNITECNLTDDRLSVFVEAPEVAMRAPALLEGYRPKIEQQHPEDPDAYIEDVVHAGFYFGNSETGGGALTIVPRLVVRICRNGLQIKKEAFRKVHLGGNLDEGTIDWSDETRQRNIDLTRSQVKDAVQAFLNQDFLEHQVQKIEREAGVRLSNPQETIEVVGNKLQYTEAQRRGILARFIEGGQCTSGGVMQAVTLHAQSIDNPDTAIDFEATGLDAMKIAGQHEARLAAALR